MAAKSLMVSLRRRFIALQIPGLHVGYDNGGVMQKMSSASLMAYYFPNQRGLPSRGNSE